MRPTTRAPHEVPSPHAEAVVSGLKLEPRRGTWLQPCAVYTLPTSRLRRALRAARGGRGGPAGAGLGPTRGGRSGEARVGSRARRGAQGHGAAARGVCGGAGCVRGSAGVGPFRREETPSRSRRDLGARGRERSGPPTLARAWALLLLLGAQGQGSTPSPRCDCVHSFQKRSGLVCCRGCPAGHYLKAPCTKPCGISTCLPCPRGTFLAWENHHKTRCARCQACDEEASQVALKNCSAVADTHCGCKPGWFRDCVVSQCPHSSPFRCHPCPDCEALHRRTRAPCSSGDTHCGTCLPGFYEYGNSCVSCPTSTLEGCPVPCVAVCGWRQVFWVQVLLAGLVVPLLLGATLTYTYRRCRLCKAIVPAGEAGVEALNPLQATHLSPPDSGPTLPVTPSGSEKVCTVQLVGSSCQEAPFPEVTWSWDQLPSRALGPPPPPSPAPPAGSAAAMLQPGPQLYEVMDAVPARRWKEFVRTLGLREAEIEAVEVEVGRFRDQQYEMLKRWRQQQPAGLGAVYAALERMGLDGCAEDLRSRLQRGP
ncbi:tumor necrosis factor receptor superfamily member 25 [Mesoplodon densirostris]|uniref:tumor necrosis factor receptor superfamily member 25 n=1 Tax=Mesoplodon densirostris TaxID=48708 RepID=UPI0028DB8C87|nr:tumor necrosis factor receptor superfamily member 25 [Mesoplodon densirostris]